MAKLDKSFVINGHAEATRDRIHFSQFAVTADSLSSEEVEAIARLPELDTGCKVRVNPNKSGSAFSQMWEMGILAGFVRSGSGAINALVVFTERPNDDGSYDFGFVPLSRFKLPRQVKPAKKVAKKAPATRRVIYS